jgi:hypothetical protein
MRCSICMSTHDKPLLLNNTLRSIFSQPTATAGDAEVIVVDDRGAGDANRQVCQAFPVRYIRIDGEPGFKNPAKARNTAYRAAVGDIVICQSDDVIHSADTICRLMGELRLKEFLIATVWNVDKDLLPIGLRGFGVRGESIRLLTGRDNQRPLFFLGSLWRKDLCAIGGNDEDFPTYGKEDAWFADCLTRGLGLKVRYLDVLGYHQDHARPPDVVSMGKAANEVYRRKVSEAKKTGSWTAAGGPWHYAVSSDLN